MCNSTVLFVVTRQVEGTLLRGDISGNVFRPLVPVAMGDAVIASVHNVAHPGVEATVRLVSAADCAAALFSGWIQRFGVPAYITSDRGAQFTSALWSSLCELLSITHIQTTAYHLQFNGLVERFYRRLSKDGKC